MRDVIQYRVSYKYNFVAPHYKLDGKRWYSVAHTEAQGLAAFNNISVERAAAIIAVLSPGTSWEQNIKDAWSVCVFRDGATVTTYSANKNKAVAILEGAPLFKHVRGNKVKSFFDNIVRPETSGAVTLDRHMLRFMLKTRDDKELNKIFRSENNYSIMAERVRRAAKKHGLRPLQYQAALWLQIREDSLN